MSSRKVEQQLEGLNSLRASATAELTDVALRKALADRVNLVVAKAASIALELQHDSLIPDLLKAFDRLYENSAANDPQCWGKNAISKALKDFGHAESRVFLQGIQHVQMEPIWGGQADTAITLRGTCALALVNCTDLPRAEKLRYLVRTLTDAETPVRIDAARALEQMEGIESALLLRLKAQTGEKDASVTGQVLESLLHIEGEPGLPFVAGFLNSPNEEVREEAALALGISTLPGGVAVLIEAWKNSPGFGMSEALLRGLSASRQQSAIDFLLEVITKSRERDAIAALEALKLHGDSGEIRRRIAEAARNRTEFGIREFFRKHLKE